MNKEDLRQLVREEIESLITGGLLEGKKFDKLVRKFAAQGKKNPKGLAAYAGRKKYGKKEFQHKAAEGRKKS